MSLVNEPYGGQVDDRAQGCANVLMRQDGRGPDRTEAVVPRRQKNRLLGAALAYSRAGIPVTPSFPMLRAPGYRHWSCGCGRLDCIRPGAHPRSDALPLLSAEQIARTWGVDEAPGVMITSSGVIDLWQLPRELGALAMRLLEAQRPSVWPPLTQMSDGSWLVATLPLDGAVPVISAYGQAVRRVPHDELVSVPPSRHGRGRLHWLWAQRFPDTPVLGPGLVLASLASAAERLEPRGAADVAHVASAARAAAS